MLRQQSFRDKLTIDVIGVARISLKLFAKLVRIRSKSDDLHGAIKTRQCTSSSVMEVKLCNSVLVSGGLVAFRARGESLRFYLRKRDCFSQCIAFYGNDAGCH